MIFILKGCSEKERLVAGLGIITANLSDLISPYIGLLCCHFIASQSWRNSIGVILLAGQLEGEAHIKSPFTM